MLQDMRENHEGFFRFALRMSEKHERFFKAAPLSAEREQFFIEQAETSLGQQQDIEANDNLTFDEYLAEYFSQTEI
jgi:glutamate--cysteine ligase